MTIEYTQTAREDQLPGDIAVYAEFHDGMCTLDVFCGFAGIDSVTIFHQRYGLGIQTLYDAEQVIKYED